MERFGSSQVLDTKKITKKITKKTTRGSDSGRTYCYDEGRFAQALLFSKLGLFSDCQVQESEISNTEDEKARKVLPSLLYFLEVSSKKIQGALVM